MGYEVVVVHGDIWWYGWRYGVRGGGIWWYMVVRGGVKWYEVV